MILQARRSDTPQPAAAAATAWRRTAGPTIFCQEPFDDLEIEGLLGHHLLEAPIFLLKLAQTFGLADVYAAVLGLPAVEGLVREAVLPANVLDRPAGLVLPQEANVCSSVNLLLRNCVVARN